MSRKKFDLEYLFEIGRRIRAIRGDLDQLEFAKILGISQGSVSKYEKGNMPNAVILEKIAKYGGVSVEWLLHGEEAGPAKAAEAAPEVYEARPLVLDARALARAILLAREFINRRRLALAVEREARFISFIYEFWATEKRFPDNRELAANLDLILAPKPEDP